MTNDCPHASLRLVNGGRCILCDPDEQPSLTDAYETLEDEEARASAELSALDADAARLDLAEFVRQGWHVLEPMELEWNWHHEALCKNVQGMLEEWLHRRDDAFFKMRWQKLVMNICPSSLKSRIIMVFAVAWMWLRCPTWSVLCVSINPANVNRDSEACRDLITSAWYRETFGITWKVRDDIDSKAKFATTAGGLRISRGLQSKFTGIHVDCILLDDPDDAHDVHSEADRRARAGKLEAISSRLNDKRHFVMIVTQQRVHVDDCTGDCLGRGGWVHASYPLFYSEASRKDTPFFVDPRTLDDENLHEIRFTLEVVEAARLELGTAGFEAQYNQNPSPLEGGMLKRLWFKFFRIEGKGIDPDWKRPKGCHQGEALILGWRTANGRTELDLDWLTISVDASFGSLTETASAVGLQVLGGKGIQRFMFRDATKPRTFIDTKNAIRELMTEFPQVSRILVEKKANGAAIIEDLELEFTGLTAIEPEGGKPARAAAMSPALENPGLYVLEGEPWIDETLTELCVFPHGKRDDRVDTLSQAMNFYRESLASQNLARKNAAFKNMANAARTGRMRGFTLRR